jgi:hypothetical protein
MTREARPRLPGAAQSPSGSSSPLDPKPAPQNAGTATTNEGTTSMRNLDNDDDFNYDFNKTWQRFNRGFGAWFVFVAVLGVAWLGFLVWCLVKLVEWVTTK